jgi:hypothetical protein
VGPGKTGTNLGLAIRIRGTSLFFGCVAETSDVAPNYRKCRK